MGVATRVQPDRGTQNGTQYTANIDAASQVDGEIAGQFAPHEAATPNMRVVLDAGRLMYAGTLASKAQQTTTLIIAPGAGTDPRIDRIVIDEQTGAYSIVTGTPAASPVAPAIPAGKLYNCQIPLDENTTVITNSLITDERVIINSAPISTSMTGGLIGTTFSGASVNNYAAFTGESNVDIVLSDQHKSICPQSGTISNFRVKHGVVSADAAIYTLMIDGVDSSLTLTVTGGSLSVFTDSVNSATIIAGQTLTVKCSAGTSAVLVANWSIDIT